GTDEETMENTLDRVRSTRRSRDCHGGGRNHPGRADQEYRWREETGNMAGQYQGELDGSRSEERRVGKEGRARRVRVLAEGKGGTRKRRQRVVVDHATIMG